jgi:hypothetical protein
MALTASSLSLAGGRPFTVELTGAAEVPGPGDPDGAGTATFWMNPGQERVCFEYSVSGVADLTAAHIHRGTAGVAMPPLIGMDPTSTSGGSGCVDVERSVIQDIIRNPSGYYFNVHNAPFPPGALRGQLSRQP